MQQHNVSAFCVCVKTLSYAYIYTHLEQEDSLHVADKLNEYLSCKSENSAKSSQKVVKLAI